MLLLSFSWNDLEVTIFVIIGVQRLYFSINNVVKQSYYISQIN